MAGSPAHSAPDSSDAGLVAGFRALLDRVGFSFDRVEEAMGVGRLSGSAWQRAAQRRRLAGREPFSVLARFFLLEDQLDAQDLERALHPFPLDGLLRLGLGTVEAGRATPAVKLVPHGDYLLACDKGDASDPATGFDYVPGVQDPSVTLAKLAVRRPAGAALDLGTGSGLQALLAARHCRRVVATDVNSRALTFARFNARLNGIDNVEFRSGWGFDPVAGETFDLIVSNPPYVVSPDHTYAFRDSDVPGDELCRLIVQQAPGHLAEDGFAHVLVSWTHRGEEGWEAPLRAWVEGNGCDSWLLHYRSSDPLSHALGWTAPLARDDPSRFETALERWLSYLGERRIEAVAHGAVVLNRRSGGGNWIRTAPLPLERLQPASEHTRRVFAAGVLLSGIEDDEQLLGRRLILTERHRIRQSLVCRRGGIDITDTTLELTDGLGFDVGLDRYTTLLLPRLDGSRVLAEALTHTADELPLTDAGRLQFVPAALPAVRKLLELGFLEILPDS